MSRSYRISVRECVSKVIKAEDCVSTQLEMLEMLPRRADGRPSRRRAGEARLRRKANSGPEEDGVTIAVDTCRAP